jgi:hypothetical protein
VVRLPVLHGATDLRENPMAKLLALSAVAIALAVGPAAYAADEASCQQMFEKADTNKDGTVGGPEVTGFAAAYKASDPNCHQPRY